MPNEHLKIKWEKLANIKSEPDKYGIPLASLEYNLVYVGWKKHKHPQGNFKIAAKYYF